MSFRFEPTDTSVESALRRIASEQLLGAAKALRAEDAATRGVHEARKALKKTRALLRLVHRGLPDFAAENRALRDIGRCLATLRDGQVIAGLLSRLCAEAGVPDLAPAPRVAPAADLDNAAQALDFAAYRAEAWRLKGDRPEVLEHGLRQTVSAGRKGLNAALNGDDADRLHEFRKRVKDRWYQARLLHPIWPDAMQVEVEAAGNLAEKLGDRHDLDVLSARLGDSAPPDLAALIANRSAELMSEISPLARRLCAGRPTAVAELWLRWWRVAGMPSG